MDTLTLKVIDEDSTEQDVREAIAHVLHDLSRMTVKDPRYAPRHAFLDRLCEML